MTPRPWRPALLLLAATAAAALALTLAVALSLALQEGDSGRYEYALWRWEAETLPASALALLGLRGEALEAGEAAARLQAYFALTSAIRAESAAPAPDQARIEALTRERARYENDVERIIEGYVRDAVVAAGLKRRLPIFRDVTALWPPVDIELTNPPQLLVRSPRDEIRRTGDTLLRPDLDLAAIEAIEAAADDAETVSLVVQIGGLASYPAIIREDRAYTTVLRVAAHEWVHHYLAFYPLGAAFGSREGTTLNESVADLAEREIARIARALHPVALPAGADGRAPAREPSPLVRSVELRELRLQVDALLAEGRVAEAEALMEERRLHLAEHGIVIRKINQAYFAFYGSYGSLPESTDPIGPKVERVWIETGDLLPFLALMREVRSEADLDALLTRLGVDPSSIPVD